jgi:DNA-binding protein YbaB
VSENPGPGTGDGGSEQADGYDLAAFMGDFEKQMSALRQESQRMKPFIDATSVRVESDGHEVAVTATIAGELVDVEFLPAAASKTPAELSAIILSTYDLASTKARGRGHEIVEGFLDRNAELRNLARTLVEDAQAQRARQTDNESPDQSEKA